MATINWTGANYGGWATATNWSPAMVPGAGDDVAIAANSPVVSSNVGTVNSISTTSYGTSLYLLGGTLAVAGDLKSAAGGLYVDAFVPGGGSAAGGSTLTVGGTLAMATNYVIVGNINLNTPTRVSVGHLNNGYSLAVTGSAAVQAEFDVADAAGFGTAGILSGQVSLTNQALLRFASGSITSVGTAANSFATLNISGPSAFVATGAATGSNSALTTLQTNYGYIRLEKGAALAISGDLANLQTLQLDESSARDGTQFQDGGSTLTVAGTLTNGGTRAAVLTIGGTNLTSAVSVSLGGLVNSGTIALAGTTAGRGTLSVQGAAGFGTAGTITGFLSLTGNAALTFGSGTLTSIASGSSLTLDGADLSLSPALQGLADNAGTLTATGETASFGAFSNEGYATVDGQDGATALSFNGTLTNSGSLTIGYGATPSNGYSAPSPGDPFATTVTVAGLNNSKIITINGDATQHSLIVGGPADLGTAGVLTGQVSLSGPHALLQFANGAIAAIASGASLTLSNGATIADAGATGSNGALALSSNAGTLNLSGNEALSSPGNLVDLAGSQLALSNTSSLSVGKSLASTGTINVFDSASLKVGGAFNNSGTVTYSGGDTASPTLSAASLVNGGTLTIRAGSQATTTATIAGDASNSGAISIGFYPSAGAALNVGGALTNTGSLELEDTASLTAASFAQTATGSLAFDAAPSTAVDSVQISGAASLDGALQVGTQGLAAGQSFTIATIKAGSLGGIFHSVANRYASNTSGSRLDLGNGNTLAVAYNASAGTITGTVYATPSSYADTFVGVAGDFNTAVNWSNGAPLPYSDVDIGKTVPARVTLGTDATVNSLVLESGSELDATGGASLFIGSDGDTTILANATLDTSGSSGSLDIAGNLSINSGTVRTASGLIEGNLDNAGTLEVKSGTLAIEGSINGAGRIIVDAGATLKVGSTQISNPITDNGTIEVANGTVNFNTDVAGSGAVVADNGATADITGRAPSTLGFNGVGGILQLDQPIAVTSAFSMLQPGDSIDFGGFSANSVALTSQDTLRVADAKNDTLTYALAGSAPTAGPFALYADGYGGTLATLTAVPSNAYAGDGGQDNPPALGVVYDNASGGQGVLTRNGLNWTLAFAATSGQAASPFHIVAVNRDGTDPIDAAFNLVSGGGTGSDVTLLGGGNAAVSGVKPGGYTLADGSPGYGPHVQVSVGTPTKFEVDSATSDGATTFPAETLTILYGLSPIGNADGGIDPTSSNSSSNTTTTMTRPKVNPDPIILPGGGGGGHATGDVHYLTFDGVAYDLQQAGEFVLARSTQSGDNFQVQIRTQPGAASGSTVSITKQVAIALGADRVTFGVGRASEVMVDGQAVTIDAAHPVDTLAGGTVTLTAPQTYEIKAAGGETVDLSVLGSLINTSSLTLGRFGGVVGLLGTDSGLASRDFQTADGTVLSTPISQSDLAAFGNSWRITDATSLLDYAPGESTATYQNTTFPAVPVAIGDLPANVVSAATAIVDAAGITDPTLRANATLDYALTNDASLVAATKTLQQVGAVASYTLTPTGNGTAATGIGITAPSTSVTANASGSTAVTFIAYATAPVAADTVVNYAGVANGNGYFGAAAFGGTFPQGSVTIAAGASSASFTVNVPNGALGALASDKLRVAVSDPAAGLPVFVPTADVTVASASATAGTAASPAFVDLTNQGSFSGSGQSYTLDFGSVAQGASVFAGLGVANLGAIPANDLGGSFDLGAGAFSVSGVAAFSGIAAQGTQAGLNIVAETSVAGAHSETITLHPTQANPSGFNGTLPDVTLLITDTVVAKAPPPVAPTITGTAANQQTSAEAPVKLFSNVTIGDGNAGASDTLTITMGGGGTLAGAGVASNGVYTLSGSAAAVTSQLQAATFTPAAGQPNTSSISSFALSDTSSGYGTATVDGTTSVVNTDQAVPPTIAGTAANQQTTGEAPVKSFSNVVVGDRNAGGTETLTITVGGGGGTLSGGGLSGGANGVYSLGGSVAAVTGQLDALSFTPNPGATSTLSLSLKSSAFATPTVDGTTSVADTSTASAPVVTITSPAAGATLSIIDPTIAGTVDVADAGSTVTLSLGQQVLGTATVGTDGGWSLRPTFAADGTYTVTASDSNVGGIGMATDTFTLDSSPNQLLFGAVTHDVTSAGGDITALYQTIFGRAPDAVGFEGWVAAEQNGTPLATIAQGFLASTEYTNDYGSAVQADSSFVNQLYVDGLRRQAEPAGLSYWDGLLAGGTSRAQVAADIATSPESRNDLAATFQQGVFVPSATDALIARLYNGLLDRVPDAGGLQGWEQQVANGTTPTQVAQGFLNSQEYANGGQVGSSNAAFVNALYEGALGRGTVGDPAAQGWVGALDAGTLTRAGVAVGVVGSTEATLHNAPAVESGFHIA